MSALSNQQLTAAFAMRVASLTGTAAAVSRCEQGESDRGQADSEIPGARIATGTLPPVAEAPSQAALPLPDIGVGESSASEIFLTKMAPIHRVEELVAP